MLFRSRVCLCLRPGEITFVTFKCTKALSRRHYVFTLSAPQSVCLSIVMLHIKQIKLSEYLLFACIARRSSETAHSICRHFLPFLFFSFLFFSLLFSSFLFSFLFLFFSFILFSSSQKKLMLEEKRRNPHSSPSSLERDVAV